MYDPHGNERGEAVLEDWLRPGDTIRTEDGALRVLGVLPTEGDSPNYAAMLMVEPA